MATSASGAQEADNWQGSPRSARSASSKRSPFHRRGRKLSFTESPTPLLAHREGESFATSEADKQGESFIDRLKATQADSAEHAQPSPDERTSYDGASMGQRSLAMSMEFFDAEEALESASDGSTQPDDSLSLRERLQHEVRCRLQVQEALSAIQAERNELLERLSKCRQQEEAMHRKAEASEEIAQSRGEMSEGGDRAIVDGAPKMEEQSTEGIRDEINQEKDGLELASATNEVEREAGGAGILTPEGGLEVKADLPPQAAEVPSVAGTWDQERTRLEAEVRDLQLKLERANSENAKLRLKLDYWERVNEEYRVQREEAKEKKREERRRVRRRRTWTLALLGGSVGLCIVGGATYGAYRYWHGHIPSIWTRVGNDSCANEPHIMEGKVEVAPEEGRLR